MMRERPTLFSGPMVKALLGGAKTQTRRLVTGYRIEGPDRRGIFDWYRADKWVGAHGGRDLSSGAPLRFALRSAAALCPYGAPGDRLWVREGFAPADGASRITLELTEVRVQRLQEISEEDARAEGVDADPVEAWFDSVGGPGDPYEAACAKLYRCGFAKLWDAINGKRAPWASNPWVWAITFRRVM